MLNAISSFDSGVVPGLAQPNAPPRVAQSATAAKGPAAGVAPRGEEESVQPRYAEYAKLAKADDKLGEVAKSVREAGKALEKVADTVQTLKKGAQDVIKNYPPFPANDERSNYLMSINGLRKQMEAILVPPVEDSNGPVFYPQEDKLPELDPKSASEKDLKEFLDAIAQLEEKVEKGFVELKTAFDALPEKINQDLVIPLKVERQADDVSRTAADDLQRTGVSVLAESSALSALGQ